MKSAFCLLALFASTTTTFAAPAEMVSCKAADYRQIESALDRMVVLGGANLKNDVLSLLRQEMGPTCNVLLARPQIGIPGNHSTTYILASGSETYQIVIHTSVEMPRSAGVYITKK